MASIGFFPSSSQVAIFGGQYIQNNAGVQNHRHKHLIPLYNEVAPNAILNSGGRPDPVRYFPGTREEVLERLNRWQAYGYMSDRRIFWLSGPAGAGKSAIAQTIAEHWIERDAAVAAFFFHRGDPSRNDIRLVVATLLCQILCVYPKLKSRINSIIAHNPVILRQSVHAQFQRLIYEPVSSIRYWSYRDHPPIILLIDGLDECESESTKEDQRSLLHILHNLATRRDSPFIVLVASRPEPHLVMVFNEIGMFHNSIFLDDSYRPSDDIRRFIVGELTSIKSTHHLGRSLDTDWPSEAMVTSIVSKSSGQFVYAATVARFIRNSSASPAISMQIVLGLRPVKKVSPFKDIDAIYAQILSQAEDWDAVRDILVTDKILKTLPKLSGMSHYSINPYLNRAFSSPEHIHVDVESCLSDLTSIVRYLEAGYDGFSLQFYHTSLEDFLYDQTRAGKFYIDLNSVACNLLEAHFEEKPNLKSNTLVVIVQILSHVTNPSAAVTQALQHADLLHVPYYSSWGGSFPKLPSIFFAKVDELYKQRDPFLHKSIVRNWRVWFRLHNIGAMPFPKF